MSTPRRTGGTGDDAPADGSGDGDVGDGAAVPSETSAAVAYWYRRDPSLHPAEIAAKIGRSERTVRRYWPPSARSTANGHDARHLASQLRAA